MSLFTVSRASGSRNAEFTSRIDSLISAHPTAVKVARKASVALAIMGILAASIPLIAPTWSVVLLANCTMTGVALTVASLCVYFLIPQREQAMIKRGVAVVSAAEHGRLDIIRELLSEGAVISEKYRGLAVINAACKGHLTIVRELLSEGAVISQQHRGWAVSEAAQQGHLAIMQFLLQGHPLL
jgi:hypothetical protein